MNLITDFDPWCSKFCTCPPKLTFNPYTGCDHMCIYCYASSYIPRFYNCRPKKDLVSRLKKEAVKLKGEILSIANSSDPYPDLEAKTFLTRTCLEILSKENCRIQIITKSDLVTRDIDLLKRIPSTVSFTITTGDDKTARLIEPNAPPPSRRLKAVEILIRKGVPTSVRIDPIILFLNDEPENLIGRLASMGVKHVTASTYKIKPDNWRRLSTVLPKTAKKLEPLYFRNGEKISNYILLPKELREKLLRRTKASAEDHDMKFGTCREGLSHLDTATCDGSWLLER